jgi:2'-5' RNA ligase
VSQPEKQRLFFALNPSPVVRQQLDAVRLQMGIVGARPVPVENLHVTLVFLGQVESSRIESLLGLMTRLDPPGCELVIDRSGWFRRPRAGWIGCSDVPAQALAFQQALENGVQKLGFSLDAQPWKPHVTVYRKMRMAPAIVPFKPIRWQLDSYNLMASEQRPGGVQYRSLGHRVAKC